MKEILVLNMNPAIDKTVALDNFKKGELNRVEIISEDFAGKGMNVALALKKLNLPVRMIGFLGWKQAKDYLSFIEKNEISQNHIIIEGDIRTNMKLVEKSTNLVTEINEPGFYVSDKEYLDFIKEFESTISNQLVVITGSVPKGVPDDAYLELTNISKRNGAKVILDADGVLLEKAILAKPDYIKPNLDELKGLLKCDLKSKEEIIKGVILRKEFNDINVIISLGKDGSIYCSNNKSLYAMPLSIKARSTVGAGDSALSGLVYAIYNELDSKNMLKWFNVMGALAAMQEGTKAPDVSYSKEMLKEVVVKKWTGETYD